MIDLLLTAKPLATFYLISRIVDWPLPSPSTATAQARNHRLGQTGGMRRQRRLGGSSSGHANAIGAKDYTGKGICFPQTLHLARAKVPDQSFSLLELRVSRTFSRPVAAPAFFRPWIPISTRCHHFLSSLGAFLAA